MHRPQKTSVAEEHTSKNTNVTFGDKVAGGAGVIVIVVAAFRGVMLQASLSNQNDMRNIFLVMGALLLTASMYLTWKIIRK